VVTKKKREKLVEQRRGRKGKRRQGRKELKPNKSRGINDLVEKGQGETK